MLVIFIFQMVFGSGCFERNELFDPKTGLNDEIVSIEITPSGLSIPVGLEYKLKAIARYGNGSTKDISSEAHWESGDPFIAQVDTDGKVTGIQPGYTNITAFYDGRSAECAAEITGGYLISIQITPENPTNPEVHFAIHRYRPFF